jgi:methyl-accepting chemotaxis protein
MAGRLKHLTGISMFANTSIKTLLSWGFGIIIALIVAMALVVYQKSSTVARDVQLMATDAYPKVTAAATIRFNIMRNWTNTLLLQQITDSGEVKRITEEMAANSKTISDNFAFLEKNIASEQGKLNLAAALKGRTEYTENRKRYLDLVKAGNKEETTRYLVGTLKTNLDVYTSAVGELIAYQSKRMEAEAEETHADTRVLQTTNLIVSLLIVLVSVATAVIVVRVIGKALGGEVHYANEIARQIAAGNLGVEVSIAPGDTDSLLASMKAMCSRLREMVRNIDASATQVGNSARQLAQTSHAVATASAQQSEATTATAAAVEQMTVGIGHIADSAEQAVASSRQSEDLSRKGSQVIHGAASEMSKIADSVEASSAIIATLEQQSNEISAVVNVIKEIADQTNLLALNAAIEAARAGEQGRGFAVVADEVRKLAERTTLSTQEIASTIQKIQGGTQNAVQSMVAGVDQVRSGTALAQEAGTSIREIESGAQHVVGVVNDISDSLREQSAASNEIARNVENIARMVEANNASAEGAASAARELERLAEELAKSVRSFRL